MGTQHFDVSRPHVARMYDYYLGGKDNFEADRQAADRMIARIPQIPAAARGNRQFLRHAVTAVAEAGVRQFVDIGSGLPTMENTHQVAHAVDPGIKVAYVDRDPIVISHARNILAHGGSNPYVTTLDGDLCEPAAITHLLGDFIDFTQPAAIMLVAVMHFMETPECYRLVNEYENQVAPGSHLILSHSTADLLSQEEKDVITREYRGSDASIYLRSKEEVGRFFDGLELLEPEITDVAEWRAGPHEAQPTMVWGGVGLKYG